MQDSELRGSTTPIFDALILNTSQGETLDLAPLLVEMAVYEDIFSPVLTGWITIQDTINLFDSLPLSGAESLHYKVYSWNYSKTENEELNFLNRTFDILRITDIIQINDYTKQYTLHFASPELRKNETLKVSKGYKDASISKIVADTFINDLKFEYSKVIDGTPAELHVVNVSDNNAVELFVEKTKYTEPAVSFPFMKPFDIISWLSGKALRYDMSHSANFLLFENKRGFQFTTIDTLLEDKPAKSKFIYGMAAQNRAVEGVSRGVWTERINEIQIQDCYDIVDNIRGGVYASRLYNYSIETGNTVEVDYNYIQEFPKTESTERLVVGRDYPILAETMTDLSDKPLSNRMLVVQSPDIGTSNITSMPTERLAGAEEYIQKRQSQLGRLSNFRMLLDISGNTKHKVGDLVEIDIKTPLYTEDSVDFKEESSKYYSGNYLITSIKHMITKTEYKMNIETMKDSYPTEIF